MKTLLAASAILLAIAAPAAAQTANQNDTPDSSGVFKPYDDNGNGAGAGNGGEGPLIDDSTTQSVPFTDDSGLPSRSNSSPVDEDSDTNGDRPVGGRAG